MLTQLFHLLTFPCLLKRMVKKKQKRILSKKNAKINSIFATLKKLLEISAFSNIAAQAFETGDFLNIFLRFLDF